MRACVGVLPPLSSVTWAPHGPSSGKVVGDTHTPLLAPPTLRKMAAASEPTAAGRVVLQVVDGDANGLRALASAIVSRPGFVVVLVSAARPALVVAARSLDGQVSANDVVKALITAFGGRGGGKPELAQAGGLEGSPEDILSAARRILAL